MSSVNFLLDKTLGKYKVLEHIGHGGMAEVYKGQQVHLDRMVAVKVLHPFLADEEGFVVRFQREARIVATLRHPNIVQVYDFDYNNELNIYYMVMEFIDGPTLKSCLSDGALPIDRVVQIGAAIADAMDYAHQRGMVHRDIKPANIMFTGDNEPVLTDFGIAKMLTLSGLTASGAMIGTPAYMAPEVGMGKPGTSAADIYSLGVVLYQMATGRLPFESESPMGMVMQHINDPPPKPSEFAPELSKELETVILRSLEKQPEARYTSAGEMAIVLRDLGGLATPRRLAGESPPQGDAALALKPDSATLTTPALTPSVPFALTEEDDRLLRTWPSNAVTPLSTVLTADEKGRKKRPKRQRSFLGRLLRTLFLLVLLALVGAFAWVALGGYVPPQVQAYLPPLDFINLDALNLDFINLDFLTPQPKTATPVVVVVPTETATPAPEDTPVPTESPTSAPMPTSTLTPEPTPTLETVASCSYRLKLEQLSFDPDDTLPPDTPFITYISLSNNGNCVWPDGLQLEFVSGNQMGAAEAVPVTPLEPQESMQILLSMTSPTELSSYESRWEVRQTDDRALGSAIIIRITVADVALPTPLPVETPIVQETEVVPLTLAEPVLDSWRDDAPTGRWYGTIILQASGGTGTYRYYRGEVRDDTLLPDGKLEFEAKRCEAFPLTILVISGEKVISWEGLIPYPDSERCQ